MLRSSLVLFPYQDKKLVFLFYTYGMQKMSPENKKRIKELDAKLHVLQDELIKANQKEGKNPHIEVKIKKNQAHFQRIKQKGVEDKAVGKFYIEVAITSKQQEVFVPVSIASGKKTAGFMYQIEGTAPGAIVTADVTVRGDEVSQVTLGTLLFAKIPTGKTATFRIQSTIRGKFGKSYKIVFSRLNYKLYLPDLRYQQYLKEIHSESVVFS